MYSLSFIKVGVDDDFLLCLSLHLPLVEASELVTYSSILRDGLKYLTFPLFTRIGSAHLLSTSTRRHVISPLLLTQPISHLLILFVLLYSVLLHSSIDTPADGVDPSISKMVSPQPIPRTTTLIDTRGTGLLLFHICVA